MAILDATQRLDKAAAHRDLAVFRDWLRGRDGFSEADGVGRLRGLPALAPLIGMYGGNAYPTRLRFEVGLSGVFRADLVAGRPGASGSFVLVEFEGAEASSLFALKGTNQMRAWGRPLERALSQVADWSWIKNDHQKSDAYRAVFESARMSETYVVVCGRGEGLGDTERSRLHWRASKTSIANDVILIQTWDDLADHIERTLEILES